MNSYQNIFDWLKAVEERGTQQEKELWLKFKNDYFTKDEIEYEVIMSDRCEETCDLIFTNDLFRNNLFLHYENTKLIYCSNNIKELLNKCNPQTYCDQEFVIYRFDKINKETKYDIIKTFFTERYPSFLGYKDIYEEFNSFKKKVKNMSKNILDLFMKNLNYNLITNKNNKWEEFNDITILDNDGNSMYILCENSDYYYLFLWDGS